MSEPTNESLDVAASPASVAKLNLAARMERLPLTRHQNVLFLVVATAWLFDSVDIASLTFVLSPISDEFGLSAGQAGLLASSSFAGMAIGASSAGLLADRFGRRPVFVTSMICWGLASLGLALSWDLTSLLVFRFVLGLGMGAEFPIAQSILSEFIPSEHRGRYLGWLEGFWPLGFILAGCLSLLLVPAFGWRSIFVLQFLFAAFALVVRRNIPESPRWYESRGRFADAERAITDFESAVQKARGRPLPEPGTIRVDADPVSRRRPLAELLSGAYRRRTLMSWSMWFCVLLGYYGITSWIAKLLADSGFTITESITFVLLMALWGIPGFLTASALLERLGRRPVVASFILLSAAAAFLYGQAAGTWQLIAAGSLMQFFMFGMWSTIYAYTPELFPTRARATGCGTSSAVGRIGALLGPSIVPIVLVGWGTGAVFALSALAFAVAAGVVLMFGPETRAKPLEAVSG